MGNLAKRVVVAVIGIPIAFAFIYVGDLAFAMFLATLATLGTRELFHLARLKDVHAFEGIGLSLAAGIPVAVHLVRVGVVGRPVGVAAVLLVAVTGIAVWGRSPEERPLEAVAVTVFGPLYCGGTLAFGYVLRHHAWTVGAVSGTALLLYPLVVTWATDIGAYFVGRALGRQKLMPSVSPGKTVAGAVGGLALAIVASLLYNRTILRPQAHLTLVGATVLAFAILTSVAAQVGDLAESLFKREAGVKDSSLLLPGHGGMLDRLDSIYFVLPVAYLFLSRFLLPVPV